MRSTRKTSADTSCKNGSGAITSDHQRTADYLPTDLNTTLKKHFCKILLESLSRKDQVQIAEVSRPRLNVRTPRYVFSMLSGDLFFGFPGRDHTPFEKGCSDFVQKRRGIYETWRFRHHSLDNFVAQTTLKGPFVALSTRTHACSDL